MRQKRISDYGYRIGHHESGPQNKITDVPGVRVGHATVESGNQHTGVTVIVPGEGNPFLKKYLASAYVHNGFGKTCGLVQVQELGTLETPIALTNTLNVGKVADAMISWMIQQTKKEGEDVFSINPVVGECNDSRINEIGNRVVGEKELYQALEQADTDFAEGAVGAGTGTICYGLKGGIGSSSRTLVLDGKTYTIGVLVQSNFGATRDLKISGKPAGERILEQIRKEECGSSAEDRGSIMTVLATDLPVSERQLYRIIRRCGVGIARTGARKDDPVDGLDVSILQDAFLHPVLGIGDPKTDPRIGFVGGIRGYQELERRVHEDCVAAFAMYPTSIQELFAVADTGRLMPPKSTWFEPKLRSGLYIHAF